MAQTPESQRAARFRARVRANGTVPEHVHGTNHGYNAYGCRCDDCCAAEVRHKAKVKERNALMREVFAEVVYSECHPGMDHPAMRYIEVQITRSLWDEARKYRK